MSYKKSSLMIIHRADNLKSNYFIVRYEIFVPRNAMV